MTLLFFDGFDHYSSSQGVRKWEYWGATGWSGGTYPEITTGGRLGTNRVYMHANGAHTFSAVKKILSADEDTLICGFAFMDGGGDATRYHMRFLNGANTQVYLYCEPATQRMYVYNGLGAILGYSNQAMPYGSFTYVEIKITFGNPGSWEMRFNGGTVPVSSGTGNTGPYGNYANIVSFGVYAGLLSSGYFSIDDFYLCNNEGSLNNDFLGDVRIETLFPDGVGNYAEFTSSTGNPNWENCADNPQDDDVSTNYSSTPGDLDSFNFDNLDALAGIIYGIQTVTCARKEAGNREIEHFLRMAGTDYPSGTSIPMLTSYMDLRTIWEENPSAAPGTRFTISDVNDSEYGYEIDV